MKGTRISSLMCFFVSEIALLQRDRRRVTCDGIYFLASLTFPHSA